MKCLRISNGGKYISKEFENHYLSHGIRHERGVPGISKRNGVVERINQTIMDKVKHMLRIANLSKSLWDETTRTVFYLINMSPLVSMDFDMQEKIWTRWDVSFSHSKVFGCKAFAYVPNG